MEDQTQKKCWPRRVVEARREGAATHQKGGPVRVAFRILQGEKLRKKTYIYIYIYICTLFDLVHLQNRRNINYRYNGSTLFITNITQIKQVNFLNLYDQDNMFRLCLLYNLSNL